ncbi:MAG TPA: branched-chain amino acid ABC transporter permease [Thermoflexus sp.]|nr:branched-chain amino acid ABC transporter permease [Thermoflexus sp.]
MALLDQTRAATSSPLEARSLILAGLTVGLLLLPVVQVITDGYNYVLHVLTVIFMYIALASGWNIIGGYAGYTSLGHPVFFALGAYFSGVLLVYRGWSPFWTAPLAGLMATLFGLVIGLITLRTRGPAFVISTIALLLLARLVLDNWEWVGGSNGLSLPMIGWPYRFYKIPFYYGMLITALAAVWTSYRIRHSKLGLFLRAIAMDEVKAEVAGVHTSMCKIIAFAISAFFAGVCGALWGYHQTYLRPTIFLTIGAAADLVLINLVGGRGTVAGPVLGAALRIGLDELVVNQLGSTELNITATGLLMILIVLFFPGGIIGALRERGRLPRLLDWD